MTANSWSSSHYLEYSLDDPANLLGQGEVIELSMAKAMTAEKRMVSVLRARQYESLTHEWLEPLTVTTDGHHHYIITSGRQKMTTMRTLRTTMTKFQTTV